jgi:nucleoside-diphosphate-sugar epimerase
MRIAVVGATGHVGSYLVPRLVAGGHEVVALSRGGREPYIAHRAWSQVERVTVDRDAEDAEGKFGPRVAALDADVVVDMICFTPDSARHLADSLTGTGTHLVHCGTIWVHGPAVEVPVTEEAIRTPFGPYGTAKAEIEAMLIAAARRGRLRATVLHPGHIVGPGWRAINPRAMLDLETFTALATGAEVVLPDQGTSTLHHVHADDVAEAFQLAIERPAASVGEAFHVVSGRALTLHGYAKAVAGWFDEDANLSFLPWEQWKAPLSTDDAAMAWDHVVRSPCASIEKARRLLGYEPRWSSLDAVREALAWLISAGDLDTGGRTLVG